MALLKVLLLKFINLSDQLAGKLGFDRYSKDWVEKYVLCDPVTAACFNLECDVCSEGKLLRVDAPPADGEDQHVTYVWWQNDDVTNRINQTSVTQSVIPMHQSALRCTS